MERRGAAALNVEFGAVTAYRLQAVRNRTEQVEIGRAEILRIYRVRPRSSFRVAAPVMAPRWDSAPDLALDTLPPAVALSSPQAKGGAVAGVAGALAGGVIGYAARSKTKELVYTSE